MTECTRRRLLALGGALTAGALAGCAGGETPTDNAASTGEGPVLEALTLENLHDRSHTLDIIIERDDEVLSWTTHELAAKSEADSSLALGSELPADPGPFELRVRLDDDTREQFASTQLSGRDCFDLLVMVTREGDLSILSEVGGGVCATDEDSDADGATDGSDDTDESTGDQ